MEFVTTMLIPEIAVTPAPFDSPVEEPSSPFSWTNIKLEENDSFRQQHLTPPPIGSLRGKQLSPLRPSNAPVTGKGLERERFEAMLQASRERNAAVGSRKPTALRKEVALKQHQSKQLERRMLFLSKLRAPPSPTATLLPKTPPESPAVFHYTLPSPGLESPLDVFEQFVSENPARISSEPRVEQVYFHLPGDASKSAKSSTAKLPSTSVTRKGSSKRLPSLDQITARISCQGQVPLTPTVRVLRPASRLPAFLRSSKPTPKGIPAPAKEVPLPKPTPSSASAPKRPSLASVGRLRIPERPASTTIVAPSPVKAIMCTLIPPTPVSPKLEVLTTLVSRSTSASPSNLSETNLMAFDSKTVQRKNMLSVIKRRTSVDVTVTGTRGAGHGLTASDLKELMERRMKRNSAPPELQALQRGGFQHPVLALPGGF